MSELKKVWDSIFCVTRILHGKLRIVYFLSPGIYWKSVRGWVYLPAIFSPILAFSVRAIDIDQESIDYLHQELSEYQDRILYGDFLKTDIRQYYQEPFSVIGNLPYNISSQIFFRIIENRHLVRQVVCMIQKEVAERIAASPGSKTYGILSVFLQAFYHIEYLFTVGEKVFDPPPKVKSAVIRLTRNERVELGCEEKLFFNVVKTGFNQRRKTLRNSIRGIIPPGFDSPYLNLRPEQLGITDFLQLCQDIEKNRNIGDKA